MTIFYHGIPEDMEGNELLPLTEIFERRPDLHQKYLEKYEGREEILKRHIPLLDCGWNDVIQLLPLNPRRLFELQKELGIINEIPHYSYFEIDMKILDPSRTVVYFKTAPGEENVIVKWLDDVNPDTLLEVPEATRNYYESMMGSANPVFNYQFVPHIVYRGHIDVSDVKKLSLR